VALEQLSTEMKLITAVFANPLFQIGFAVWTGLYLIEVAQGQYKGAVFWIMVGAAIAFL
jgi:hypothetical protein